MPVKPFPYIKDSEVGDVPIGFFPKPDTTYKEILGKTWGLEEHCQLADCSEGRGIYPLNGKLYCLAERGARTILFEVNTTGASTEIGTITTSDSGPVWMRDNPTQLGMVDGVWTYTYTPSTGLFEKVTDLDFPGASNFDYLEGLGLFVQPNSNQWFFSNLNDFKNYDPNNNYFFGSKTGNLVAILVFVLEVYVLGEKGSEIWYFAGGSNQTDQDPTFARNTAGVIEYGCGAIGTPNTADGTIPNWLSNQGQWIAAAGYQGRVVSNQIFDKALKEMGQYSDATCFSWRDGGHVFTAMTFPTGGQTWVMDWATQSLFKISSYLSDGSGWGRWRVNCICKLENVLYGMDYENGKVYRISTDYYDDDTHPIQRVLHAQEFNGGNHEIEFGKMRLDMKMGIGLLSRTEPQVMMQRSIDSGQTWSAAAWRGAGLIGEHKKAPPTWNRGGQSRKALYKFTFTDSVDWEVRGLDLELKILNE